MNEEVDVKKETVAEDDLADDYAMDLADDYAMDFC